MHPFKATHSIAKGRELELKLLTRDISKLRRVSVEIGAAAFKLAITRPADHHVTDGAFEKPAVISTRPPRLVGTSAHAHAVDRSPKLTNMLLVFPSWSGSVAGRNRPWLL